MTEGRTVKVERSRARGHVASNTLTVRPGVIKSRARFCFGPLQEARPNKSIPVTKNPLLLPVRFFEASADRVFSFRLVVWLERVENAPWAGSKISERWLARQLKPYGILPRTIWLMELSAKGYMREDFAEVFRRYLPPSCLWFLADG